MKAARYFDRGDIRIQDVPEPEVQLGTVGIDVAWCGICGTDLHEYLDGPIFVPPAGHPHPVSGESAPITLGHEMSGTVYAVGDDVTDLKVGDNVVVEPYIIDPKESTEPGSNYHLTPNMNFIGLAGRGGGLGEKIVVERRWVHPIGTIPLDQAALIEPLSVGYHAYVRSGAKAGDIALIGGAGPIGLLTAAVLKANGITVIMSELSELRRRRPWTPGWPTTRSTRRRLMLCRKCGGSAAAPAPTWRSSAARSTWCWTRCSTRSGRAASSSSWRFGATPLSSICRSWCSRRSTCAAPSPIWAITPTSSGWSRTGRSNWRPFITGKIGLEHLIDEGFDTLIHHNDTAVKILVSPSGRGLG